LFNRWFFTRPWIGLRTRDLLAARLLSRLRRPLLPGLISWLILIGLFLPLSGRELIIGARLI